MNLAQLKDFIHEQLSTCDECDAQYETRYILKDTAGCDWTDLISAPDRTIPQNTINTIKDIVNKRKTGMPLSRIYNEREFYGLNFKLSPETLDPRPDTELLVDLTLSFIKNNPNAQILDMGTGTGCIPISILKNAPHINATAIDINNNALITAKQNAHIHKVETRIEFIQSDWFENLQNKKFDLIISNPPYIDSDKMQKLSPTVQNYDPALALDGGKNGLNPYKIIFSQIKNHLNIDGKGLFEIGYDHCGQIVQCAEDYGIRKIYTHKDIAGIPRVVEISCGDK